jgi:hypothetical protein
MCGIILLLFAFENKSYLRWLLGHTGTKPHPLPIHAVAGLPQVIRIDPASPLVSMNPPPWVHTHMTYALHECRPRRHITFHSL